MFRAYVITSRKALRFVTVQIQNQIHTQCQWTTSALLYMYVLLKYTSDLGLGDKTKKNK